ncbi:MAG: hypothetical protein M3041_16255 [Acidobacteriota bacterium]|nr:hypothetical protein [Acidobacteriota bacterium]
MTDDDRALIAITAQFLRAAAKVQWLAMGLTILAVASMLFTSGRRTPAIAAIALGIISIYYGVRIAFDARLLEDIATETLTVADLDSVFVKNKGRSWPDRCRGARRLVAFGAAATIAQMIAAAWIR